MEQQSAKSVEDEKDELKNKIMKLQEEKNELTTILLAKTEKNCDLKLKMIKMEAKIEKMEAKIENLEETVKGFEEKPATSSMGGGKQRKMSPCKGRETLYAMMEEWSFRGEIDKMNYKVLHWMEKTVKTIRLPQVPTITPQKFMERLADGLILYRLANVLGEDQKQFNEHPTDKKECYEYFYKFAREKAKLAEGCIFLEEELFGETYDDYKSVFYTLFKLATQTKEKFNKKTMWDIEHDDNQDKEDKIAQRHANLLNSFGTSTAMFTPLC